MRSRYKSGNKMNPINENKKPTTRQVAYVNSLISSMSSYEETRLDEVLVGINTRKEMSNLISSLEEEYNEYNILVEVVGLGQD